MPSEPNKKGPISVELTLEICVPRKRFHPASALVRQIDLLAVIMYALSGDLCGNLRKSS